MHPSQITFIAHDSDGKSAPAVVYDIEGNNRDFVLNAVKSRVRCLLSECSFIGGTRYQIVLDLDFTDEP